MQLGDMPRQQSLLEPDIPPIGSGPNDFPPQAQPILTPGHIFDSWYGNPNRFPTVQTPTQQNPPSYARWGDERNYIVESGGTIDAGDHSMDDWWHQPFDGAVASGSIGTMPQGGFMGTSELGPLVLPSSPSAPDSPGLFPTGADRPSVEITPGSEPDPFAFGQDPNRTYEELIDSLHPLHGSFPSPVADPAPEIAGPDVPWENPGGFDVPFTGGGPTRSGPNIGSFGNNLTLGEFLNTPLSTMRYGEGYPTYQPVGSGDISYAGTTVHTPGDDIPTAGVTPEAERQGEIETQRLRDQGLLPPSTEEPPTGRAVSPEVRRAQSVQPNINVILQQYPNLNTPAAIRALMSGSRPDQLIGRPQFDSHAANSQLMEAQARHDPVNNTGGTGDEGHTDYALRLGEPTWIFNPDTQAMEHTGPIFNGFPTGSTLTSGMSPADIAYARQLLQQDYVNNALGGAGAAGGGAAVMPVSLPPDPGTHYAPHHGT